MDKFALRCLKTAITQHVNQQIALARRPTGSCSELDDKAMQKAIQARKRLENILSALEQIP